MEKYGCDLSQLPVDKDQKEIIEKLAGDKKEVKKPKNKKEAEELIEELKKGL